MLTGAFEVRNVDGSLYVSLMECLGSRSISCFTVFYEYMSTFQITYDRMIHVGRDKG